VAKFAAEYPGTNASASPEAHRGLALLFGDDDFVPVFGAPFDRLAEARRTEIADQIASLCKQDKAVTEVFSILEPKFREKVQEPSTAFGVPAIIAVVRESRRLRKFIRAGPPKLTDGAGLKEALAAVGPFDERIEAGKDLLWPNEHQEAAERVAAIYGKAAAADAARDFSRIGSLQDPARRLAELKTVHAGDSAYHKYLLPADRAALAARALAVQRAIADGLIGQALQALERGRESEELLREIQALSARAAATFPLLIDSLEAEYRSRIEKRLHTVLSVLMLQRLAALKLSADKAALAASARFPRELRASFGEFENTVTYRNALDAFRKLRNSQLRGAVAVFEEEVKKLPADGTRNEALGKLLREYLSWEDDDKLPSALEYQLIAESYKDPPQKSDSGKNETARKLDHSKLTDDELRTLWAQFSLVVALLSACGDEKIKDINSWFHKHHRTYSDFIKRNSDVFDPLFETRQRFEKDAQIGVMTKARFEEDARAFFKARGLKGESDEDGKRYCEERGVPAVKSGEWDFRKDEHTRGIVAKMSGR
jgi:hypothetical protein